MNVLTNYISLPSSELLDFVEALQKLIKAGQSFEFPRNGANSVLWTYPCRLNDHSIFIVDSTVGYGCSEREYLAFITDVLQRGKDLDNDIKPILFK